MLISHLRIEANPRPEMAGASAGWPSRREKQRLPDAEQVGVSAGTRAIVSARAAARSGGVTDDGPAGADIATNDNKCSRAACRLGGCGASGRRANGHHTGGCRRCQSVSLWKAMPARTSSASSRWRETSWKAIGWPASVTPQGSVMVGLPVMSNGQV